MLFNSLEFLIFFPIVIAIYNFIPYKIKNIWLLMASYFFYMCWNAKYALLMLTSTVITYLSGLAIEYVKNADESDEKKILKKKWIVAVSFISNLGILFYFKYFNFALDITSKVFAYVNIQLNVPTFDIILPVGISFYTFQALSYIMDVYRDDIYAEKNFIQYALFVSFFPQLVAGPIERSKNLLKQLAVPKSLDYEKAKDGFMLMLWGYFLKLVLADRISIFVDTVYNDYENFGGMYLIVASMLFAIQIYCDFAGYSTIAMGAAKILGVEIMENFNAPYLATTVGDFWRRWHISLTSWFKDYLYIPLGGSRKGRIRKYLNKMIVFLVSGLWHGASLTFIVWGGLNGLYQVIGELAEPTRSKIRKILHFNQESAGYKFVAAIITFVLVDFAWVFFRAQTFTQSTAIIKSMFFNYNPWILFDGSLYRCGLDSKNFMMMLIGIIILLIVDMNKTRGVVVRQLILTQDPIARWFAIATIIVFILIFGIWGPAYEASRFVYFQF